MTNVAAEAGSREPEAPILGEILTTLLGPLAGRPAAAWKQGADGKWTVAQIVEHIVLSLEASAERFEKRRDRPPMDRRSNVLQTIARNLVLRMEWFPSGGKAPAVALPSAAPDPPVLERRLRAAVARFDRLAADLLPARAHDLFVGHHIFGDLTLPEWLRFHVVHTRHHAKQLRERLV